MDRSAGVCWESASSAPSSARSTRRACTSSAAVSPAAASRAAGPGRRAQRKSPAWSAAHWAKVCAGWPVIFSTMSDVRAGMRLPGRPCAQDGFGSDRGHCLAELCPCLPGGDHLKADFPADGVADVLDLAPQGQGFRPVDGVCLVAVARFGQGGHRERGHVLFMDRGGLRVRVRKPDHVLGADRSHPPPAGVRGEHPGTDERPVQARLLNGQLDCTIIRDPGLSVHRRDTITVWL